MTEYEFVLPTNLVLIVKTPLKILLSN